MSLTISEFFDLLRGSDVLAPGEVESLLQRVPEGKRQHDAGKVAAKLVEAGKLTQYQATAILDGRGNTLAIGDYVILQPIGAGGMGQVFKARHRRMKRTVALKILPPAFAENSTAVLRFQREVEAAAKLVHPNIVAAYDASEQKGIHYLVMECVEGDDLANLVKKYGPLSVEKALSYVIQTAQGLAHAHQQGVIHRDIKPANLLVDSKGTVKILDMGLARFDDGAIAESGEGLTQTGSLMGTPDFMAPEQALDTKQADARADVYSLGCTLFYLLTGKKLYEGDTMMQRLVAHRERPIPALAIERDDLPVGLAAVFERMVAKQRGDRYQTMGDVAEALAEFRAVLVAASSSSALVDDGFASLALPSPPSSLQLPNNDAVTHIDLGTHGAMNSPRRGTSDSATSESWLHRLATPDSPSRRRLVLWGVIALSVTAPVMAVVFVIAVVFVSGKWLEKRPVATERPGKVGEALVGVPNENVHRDRPTPKPAPLGESPVKQPDRDSLVETVGKDAGQVAPAQWLNESYNTTLKHVQGKQWAEFKNDSGKVHLRYEEVSRTEDSLELFCPERNQFVRFLAKKAELKKNGKWEWGANGRWLPPNQSGASQP